MYVNVAEEEDDFELRKKQAEQRKKNLADSGVNLKEGHEITVIEKKRIGQTVGDADEHRKQSEQRK
jgi:hypothetical protein